MLAIPIRSTSALLAAALVGGSVCPAMAQSSRGGSSKATSPRVTSPYNLERIRGELAKSARLSLALPRDSTATFRVNIEQTLPDIETWLGNSRELRGGPVPMRREHAEFLRMVTPPEYTNPFSNSELLAVTGTSLLTGLLVKAAARAIARNSQGSAPGRSHGGCLAVRQTLLELNAERSKAKLPPVPLPLC